MIKNIIANNSFVKIEINEYLLVKHASSRIWFMYAYALLSVKPSNVAIWIFERK